MSRHSLLAQAENETAEPHEEGASAGAPVQASYSPSVPMPDLAQGNMSLISTDTFGFDSFWGLAPMETNTSNDLFGDFNMSLPY